MGKQRHDDPVMNSVREQFQESGLTLEQLGERMGYPTNSARQSAHQFLGAGDPQISVLRRFAKAVGTNLLRLLKN
jgi:hypothetical protein